MHSFARSHLHGAALLLASLAVSAALPVRVSAQVVDTTKKAPAVKAASPDSTKAAPGSTRRPVVRSSVLTPAGKPPITPKRAFLYSLMVPGWGQSRLDRGTAGALFAAVELGSIAMVGKTTVDLKQARRYSVDSVPANYLIDTVGKIVGSGGFGPQFPRVLINTRRLHREDWFAALMFNHLISGADAFVSAQLWDVPTTLSMKPYGDGVALIATVHW